jgi:hypothetical protein
MTWIKAGPGDFPEACRKATTTETMAMTLSQARPTASPHEIRKIVGDLDDATVTTIMQTGATEGEVLEAFLWTTSDEELGNEVERLPHGTVGAVYEILRQQEPEDG